MVAASGELQEIFAVAARAFPCSYEQPWRLIIAWDEFTPGDRFKPKNRRKVMLLSFNLLELSPEALCHELTWQTTACIRSVVISKTKGGWSRLIRIPLDRLLLGPL